MKAIMMAASLCALAALCSCTKIMDFGPRMTVKNVPALVEVSEDEYRIGVGDYLEVSIQGGDPALLNELTKVLIVLPDGTINYLYNDVTGRIYVAGKTPDEVAKMMFKDLIEKKRIQPVGTVSVIPTALRSRTISVMGEVLQPGPQSAAEPVTLVQALARAGGFKEFADTANIQLVRREGSTETRWKFNYKYWVKYPKSNKYVDMQLQSGDMIIVPEK